MKCVLNTRHPRGVSLATTIWSTSPMLVNYHLQWEPWMKKTLAPFLVGNWRGNKKKHVDWAEGSSTNKSHKAVGPDPKLCANISESGKACNCGIHSYDSKPSCPRVYQQTVPVPLATRYVFPKFTL